MFDFSKINLPQKKDIILGEFEHYIFKKVEFYLAYIALQEDFITEERRKLNEEYDKEIARLKKSESNHDYVSYLLKEKFEFMDNFMPTTIYNSTFLSIYAFIVKAFKFLYESFLNDGAVEILIKKPEIIHYRGALNNVLDFTNVKEEIKEITQLYTSIRSIFIHHDGYIPLTSKYIQQLKTSVYGKTNYSEGTQSAYIWADNLMVCTFLTKARKLFDGVLLRGN